MEYLKFENDFLESLNLQSSEDLQLDNILQGEVKNYLFLNRSFATTTEQLAIVGENIETTYRYLLQSVLPKFTEAKKLSGLKQRLHTRDLTQNYGNERVETSYFEPVENNTQSETKQNASQTTWQPDTTIETITEDELNENVALKDFYDSMQYKVGLFFARFVNNLFFGGV